MKKYRAILIILVVAFLVRSVFIGTYFTGDAIDTVGPARNYVETGRAAVYATRDTAASYGYIDDGLYFNFTHPPIRVILYSLWASFFGFSNATMILLPIIFGLLTIFLIYAIGSELYSEKTGLIAALLAAFIRYHFYASVIAFGDNFLMFAMAASFYFFLKYLKTQKNIFIITFFVFTFLGFMTKFSSISAVPIFLFMSYVYRKEISIKKTILIILISALLSVVLVYFSYPLVEHFTGVSNAEYSLFDSYIGISLTTASKSPNLLQEKIFYFLSFAWQFTPFFTALIGLALIRLRRDRNYWAMASWFLIAFLIGFATTGQDFQRLMIIAIAPALILVAKYISDIDFKEEKATLITSFLIVILLAYLTGLNDMGPYYSPATVAIFFLLGIVFMFVPDNRRALVGASLALSIFFLVGTSFLVNINSSVVQQMTDEVHERGYPYNELWTTRDISMYLAPKGEPSFLQRPQLDREFLASHNVSYFAFYSIYEESKIIGLSELCADQPFFAKANNRNVGLVCRLDKSKL